MKSNKIIFYGFGGHARVLLDILDENYQIVGFFDDGANKQHGHIPFLGRYVSDLLPNASIIIAIGDNRLRQTLSKRIVHEFANLVAQTAYISPSSEVGNGIMLLHNVVVQAGSKLGNHVIVNTGAIIDHDCVVGDFVHVAQGAVIAGRCVIGEGALIGPGAVLSTGAIVPPWSEVPAGAVIV